MSKEIFQIKISLKGSKPLIWRRVLVFSDTPLLKFHYIIINSMGWNGGHLHQFIHKGSYYSKSDDFYEVDDDVIDYSKKNIKLNYFLKKIKDKLVYEYDFGDSWIHNIELEKILPEDKALKYPTCIAGAECCPPEDCGGIYGYYQMLEILNNPSHPDHEEFKENFENFDPDDFDLEFINESL